MDRFRDGEGGVSEEFEDFSVEGEDMGGAGG